MATAETVGKGWHGRSGRARCTPSSSTLLLDP
eukprot:CAMPEP_0174728690 /NCGR_PEP_ID=MMETSP1094-20130205/52233_1 /TAXON_ID=156173 /ORGANISM="Chrysochromulina brevifilum, Strain UTEX LB 985" /LENGTH=31 /DNA_ID= /DNA_START= /DNA_END= /DNA_ORIENTATION=